MRKRILLWIGTTCCLLASGCTVEKDAAVLYAQETPLEVEILTPQSFSETSPDVIQAVLTQGGKRVTEADFVHMEIRKQDGTVTFHMEEASEEGNGVYSLKKQFERDGLYFVKVHAGNDGVIISPEKQFVVGELSASDLQFLQAGRQVSPTGHEHHH